MRLARNEDAIDVDFPLPGGVVRKRRRGARARDDDQLRRLARTILEQSSESFSPDECRDLFSTYAVLLQDTELPSDITHDDKRVSLAFQALDNFMARKTKQQWKARLCFLRMAVVMDQLGKLIKKGRMAGRVNSGAGEDDRTVAIQIHHGAVASFLSEDDVRMRRRIANRWFTYSQGSLIPLLFASDKIDQIIRDLSITLDALKVLGGHVTRLCARRSLRIAKQLADGAQKAAEDQCTLLQLEIAYSGFEMVHLGGDGQVQGLRRETDVMDQFMHVRI